MKTLLLVLSLFGAPAFAGCPPGIPKIIGIDYDFARAKLINAGFLPVMPNTATVETTPLGFWSVGYLECDGGATGTSPITCVWDGFSIHYPVGSRVRKITCP